MVTELIVPFDKTNMQKASDAFPLVLISSFFFIFISIALQRFIGNLSLIVLVPFALIHVIVLIGLAYGYYLNKSEDSAAILNQGGIWIKHFGFISWSNIDKVDCYYLPMAPVEIIGIRVKDLAQMSRNAPLSGKINFFWAKLFSYDYHINLVGIALDNGQVVAFARQFMQ